MKQEAPKIFTFEVNGKKYLYDYRIDYICEFEGDDNDFVTSWCNSISSIDDNYIADNRELCSYIDYCFEHVLPRKLILEVTEECNLRCKYCFNTIGHSVRKHSSIQMTKDIAKKGVDFYFDVYTKCFSRILPEKRNDILKTGAPNLSWWGGEPLLNWELIKYTFNYFENLPWEKYYIPKKSIVYSLVTNLTFVNKEMLDFLVENNVFLMISLDGSKDEHDLYRLQVNGKGSFDKVIENLDFLLANYPDYCKKRVIIQAVFMDGHSLLSDPNSFLNKYFIDEFGHSKVLKVNQYPQKKENSFISEKWIEVFPSFGDRIDDFKGMMMKLNQLTDDEIINCLNKNSLWKEELKDVFLIDERIVCDLSRGVKTCRKIFTCPIGRDVVYVSTKGDFHICNKTDSSWPIGNVDEGIAKQEVYTYLIEYVNVLKRKCNNCWAIHYCKMCSANLLNNSKFRLPSELECRYLKDIVKWNLSKFILLKENEDLYERLKRIYYNYKVTFLDYSYPIFID